VATALKSLSGPLVTLLAFTLVQEQLPEVAQCHEGIPVGARKHPVQGKRDVYLCGHFIA